MEKSFPLSFAGAAGKARSIVQPFFELLSNDNADACVFGMTLSVDCVCVLDPELLLEAQEELATLFSNRIIINANREQKTNVEMVLSLVTANEPIEVKTTDSLDFLLEYLKDKKS